MASYNTNNNHPIKLKVSIQTEAIPMTYTALNDSVNQENPSPDIPPFNPQKKPGWKNLNNVNIVSNKFLKVVTFSRFFINFPNEETFNLAIEQIKNTYELGLKGGLPEDYTVNDDSHEIRSYFETKTCIIISEIKLD